jgi:hypothetical protein
MPVARIDARAARPDEVAAPGDAVYQAPVDPRDSLINGPLGT